VLCYLAHLSLSLASYVIGGARVLKIECAICRKPAGTFLFENGSARMRELLVPGFLDNLEFRAAKGI
jgi:hypothetical protein